MAKKVLYEIDVKSNYKDLAAMKKELDALTNVQKAWSKGQMKNSLNAQRVDEKIRKLKTSISETKKETDNYRKATSGLGNSYNALTAQNAILSKRLRAIQDPMGKNKALFDKTALAIKNNTDKLTKMDASMGRHQRNVGNYGQAFNALTPMMGSFGSQITMIQGTLGSLKTALVGTDKAQKTTAISSRMLGMAMMAIPIVAIVGAFTALIGAFAGTQRGADALTRVMEPIKAVFGALLGVVQQLSFGAMDKLKEAINNPKQAFIDLGKVIVENVINRFKSFFVFGESLSALFSGDFKGALKLGTDAVLQLTTGVENGTDKIGSYADELGNVVTEAQKAGKEIADLQIQIEKLEIANVVPIAKLKLEFQELKEIANDQLKTEIERINALDKAMKVQEEIAKKEGDLLALRIKKMQMEQAINDTSREEQKELQELIAKQIEFEATAQKKIAGLKSLQSGLEKTWLRNRAKEYEKWLKDIEKLEEQALKVSDENEKARIKNQLDASKKHFEELQKQQKEDSDLEVKKLIEKEKNKLEAVKLVEQKTLELAQQTSDAIFAIKQANLQRQTKIELDQLQTKNDLENDLLKSKLESGLITQEEYENNRIALAQKVEEEKEKIQREAFEKQKKLQIAQAIANGALAITSILAAPQIDPTGISKLVQIGAATASTAIQVATIASQQFAKGGLLEGNSHAEGGIPMLVDGKRPIEAEGGEAIINKRSVAMFGKELDYINRAGGGVPLFENGGYIRKFANGGLIQQNGINMQDLEKQSAIFANALNNLKVINVASDTINTYDNTIRIENEFTF